MALAEHGPSRCVGLTRRSRERVREPAGETLRERAPEEDFSAERATTDAPPEARIGRVEEVAAEVGTRRARIAEFEVVVEEAGHARGDCERQRDLEAGARLNRLLEAVLEAAHRQARQEEGGWRMRDAERGQERDAPAEARLDPDAWIDRDRRRRAGGRTEPEPLHAGAVQSGVFVTPRREHADADARVDVDGTRRTPAEIGVRAVRQVVARREEHLWVRDDGSRGDVHVVALEHDRSAGTEPEVGAERMGRVHAGADEAIGHGPDGVSLGVDAGCPRDADLSAAACLRLVADFGAMERGVDDRVVVAADEVTRAHRHDADPFGSGRRRREGRAGVVVPVRLLRGRVEKNRRRAA